MSENDNKPVMTILELAERWNCSRKVIYDAISDGTLRAFRIGKRTYRVGLDEVLRIERGRAA